jgi:hypothetical protein
VAHECHQSLPPTRAVAEPSWPTAALASECLEGWTQGNKSQENHFLRYSMQAQHSQAVFLSTILYFYPLESVIGGVWSIPKMSSRHLSYYPGYKVLGFFYFWVWNWDLNSRPHTCQTGILSFEPCLQQIWLHFNGTNLLCNHVLFGWKFKFPSFLDTLQAFQISPPCSWFSPESLIVISHPPKHSGVLKFPLLDKLINHL